MHDVHDVLLEQPAQWAGHVIVQRPPSPGPKPELQVGQLVPEVQVAQFIGHATQVAAEM